VVVTFGADLRGRIPGSVS